MCYVLCRIIATATAFQHCFRLTGQIISKGMLSSLGEQIHYPCPLHSFDLGLQWRPPLASAFLCARAFCARTLQPSQACTLSSLDSATNGLPATHINLPSRYRSRSHAHLNHKLHSLLQEGWPERARWHNRIDFGLDLEDTRRIEFSCLVNF
jgi:hypothetical protein